MNERQESVPTPELPPDTRITIEPELLARVEVFSDILKDSDLSQAEMLLNLGMIDITPESIVNAALRSFLRGIDTELYDDPSGQ